MSIGKVNTGFNPLIMLFLLLIVLQGSKLHMLIVNQVIQEGLQAPQPFLKHVSRYGSILNLSWLPSVVMLLADNHVSWIG